MTCSDVQDNLADAVDGRGSPEERRAWDAHLSACPSCRAEAESYRRTIQWVAELPREKAPPDLARTIRRRIGPARAPSAGSSRSFLHVAGAAAAVLLCAVVGWRVILTEPEPRVQQEIRGSNLLKPEEKLLRPNPGFRGAAPEEKGKLGLHRERRKTSEVLDREEGARRLEDRLRKMKPKDKEPEEKREKEDKAEGEPSFEAEGADDSAPPGGASPPPAPNPRAGRAQGKGAAPRKDAKSKDPREPGSGNPADEDGWKEELGRRLKRSLAQKFGNAGAQAVKTELVFRSKNRTRHLGIIHDLLVRSMEPKCSLRLQVLWPDSPSKDAGWEVRLSAKEWKAFINRIQRHPELASRRVRGRPRRGFTDTPSAAPAPTPSARAGTPVPTPTPTPAAKGPGARRPEDGGAEEKSLGKAPEAPRIVRIRIIGG